VPRPIAFAVAVILTAMILPRPLPADWEAGDLFVRGGTVITVAGEVIEGGSILIREGKILRVGRGIETPGGIPVYDATGKYVMPGIVDTHSHMGVYSWPGVEANADGNEATDPITPEVRVVDAINVHDPAFARARAGGVTTVQILPGSANLVGGQTAVIKLRPVDTIDDLLLEGAPPGMKMAYGENPKRIYGGRKRMPSTRMGNAAVLRQAFVDAQEYMEKRARREEKGRRKAGRKPLARDLRMEALADVLRGRYRVHFHCYRADGILDLMRIADEFGFRITSFQHCLEGYKVAVEIAAREIGVSTFSDWWGYKMEAWDAIPHAAALMSRRGVRVSVHSDSGDLIQRLYHEAAKTVRYGQSEEEAFRSITLNPAWILGIDDRVGSIEPGKDGDLAIFSGHPFSIYSRVDATVIDGVPVYERP
jgi:imidazolonepropionase-like amidohydrolase